MQSVCGFHVMADWFQAGNGKRKYKPISCRSLALTQATQNGLAFELGFVLIEHSVILVDFVLSITPPQ